MAATFKDVHDVEWAVHIKFADIAEVENNTAFNFFQSVARGALPTAFLVQLVYCAVAKQAKKRGIKSYEAWLKSIGDGSLVNVLVAASVSLKRFYPESKDEEEEDADHPTENPSAGATSTDSPEPAG